MADRTYVYVDGESHFIRSERAWRDLHGEEACLEQLRYVGQADDRLVLVVPAAKVFWTRRMNPAVKRCYYFTAAAGDDSTRHRINVMLRDFEVEPCVFPERKALELQRQNVLRQQQLIEKAKCVDVALAVRMLEDSQHEVFDVCHLYSSDVDFLPLIQAVKARGKQVFVHGYKNGLADQSPLLHVPDQFVDLEKMLRNDCELLPAT